MLIDFGGMAMKQALRYMDEKSDKFWRIETEDCVLVTNWGKTGTSGRYEMKEFETAEACEKQAAKLVAAKIKKGYTDMPDFDAMQHFYFDTDEFGLHPLTSHPIFRQFFSDELYYDCADEEAPFGSDEGNDTLHILEEMVRKRPKMRLADFPEWLIEKEWDLTYLPHLPAQTDTELQAQAAQAYHNLPGTQELLQTDQVILATAFGQIKIMGKLDTTLQTLAFQSLVRMERMYRLFWNWNEAEPPYAIAIMRRDLTQFCKQDPSAFLL